MTPDEGAHEQSVEELEAHLRDQIGFLQRSAAGYDGGEKSEGKRMALAARILVHENGRNSRALLAQLGRLGEMLFFDSGFPNLPGNLGTYAGLVITAHTIDGGTYLPLLDDNQFGPGEWVPFEVWWRGVAFVDSERRVVTRRDLVLSVADQDGGAHVDPKIGSAYAALTRRNSIGWTVSSGGTERPMESPHLAALRQVTHELLKSLVPGYTCKGPAIEALMFTADAMVFDSPPTVMPAFIANAEMRQNGGGIVADSRVARNAPCPCGRPKRFKQCCGKARG